jgi:hypothetical protein
MIRTRRDFLTRVGETGGYSAAVWKARSCRRTEQIGMISERVNASAKV